MIKKVVSTLLLLLVIAGPAFATTYVYTCTWPTCGLIQQFNMSQGLLHSMRPKTTGEFCSSTAWSAV